MSALRRHLASLGLVVVCCHVVLQVLVPAALCCRQATVGRTEFRECCPAGSHPGQVCPMHPSRLAGKKSKTTCSAQAVRDFRDLVIVLNVGGVIPSPVRLLVPATVDAAFITAQPIVSPVSHVPLGPPPRA
jgi:hypothetical protein